MHQLVVQQAYDKIQRKRKDLWDLYFKPESRIPFGDWQPREEEGPIRICLRSLVNKGVPLEQLEPITTPATPIDGEAYTYELRGQDLSVIRDVIMMAFCTVENAPKEDLHMVLDFLHSFLKIIPRKFWKIPSLKWFVLRCEYLSFFCNVPMNVNVMPSPY